MDKLFCCLALGFCLSGCEATQKTLNSETELFSERPHVPIHIRHNHGLDVEQFADEGSLAIYPNLGLQNIPVITSSFNYLDLISEDDIRNISDKTQVSGRDEFESTEKYLHRLKVNGPDETFLHLPGRYDSSIVYDADAEGWLVFLYPNKLHNVSALETSAGKNTELQGVGFSLIRDTQESIGYGENAFGAGTAISITSGKTINLAVLNPVAFLPADRYRGFGELVLFLPMRPSEARQMHGHVGVALGVRHDLNYLNVSESTYIPAEMNSPTQIQLSEKYIPVHVNRISVIDLRENVEIGYINIR